jgi:hypothetical protein
LPPLAATIANATLYRYHVRILRIEIDFLWSEGWSLPENVQALKVFPLL